jgi:CopG family nickel-responsive transcriptional regulator
MDMERVTISIDGELLTTLDDLITRRGYANRSEAVRDILRQAISVDGPDDAREDREAPCLGALSYVYDHARRDLGRRLIETQHHHHDLTVATLHVHLDHRSCLEVAVLRGAPGDLRALADSVTTERGVRYGGLQLIPVARDPA